METTSAAPTKKQIIDLAYGFVYTDAELLVQDFAKVFALTNMGQQLSDYVGHHVAAQPGSVFRACWGNFYGQSESDEMAEGLDAERRAWLKDGRKLLAQVQKKGQPLTMRSMEDAWEKKGAFAKAAKKGAK